MLYQILAQRSSDPLPIGPLVAMLVVVVITLLVGISVVAAGIRIVPEHARLVVFRLGRCIGARGPGIILLMPMIDRSVSIDLRERAQPISGEPATTQDRAGVLVDFTWSYRVVDPVKSVLTVENLDAAARRTAIAALRSLIGGVSSGDLLFERARLRTELLARLREITAAWGIEVVNVEVQDIRRGVLTA